MFLFFDITQIVFINNKEHSKLHFYYSGTEDGFKSLHWCDGRFGPNSESQNRQQLDVMKNRGANFWINWWKDETTRSRDRGRVTGFTSLEAGHRSWMTPSAYSHSERFKHGSWIRDTAHTHSTYDAVVTPRASLFTSISGGAPLWRVQVWRLTGGWMGY